MQSKTRVPRSRSSLSREESFNSIDRYPGNTSHLASHERDCSEVANENQPLLSKPVNPNSALAYRPIKLPSSSLMSPKQSKSCKKAKKQFYSPSVLATDLYSTESEGTPQGLGTHESDTLLLPELHLSKASLDLEQGT